MSALILPNDIDPGSPADANEVEQNYNVIEQFVNNDLINKDGSVGMQQPLLLPGDPSSPNQAANKGYVDGRDALLLPLVGGTVTGQVKGITPVAAEDLARKDYVDSRDTALGALYLPKAGGVMTGDLHSMSPQQTNIASVTRKDYVDAQDAAIYASFRAGTNAFLRFNPSGVDDADGSVAINGWMTLGSVVVPTWANSAFCQVNVAGVYCTTSGKAVHVLNLTIGGQAGQDGGRLDFMSTSAADQRQGASFAVAIALGGSGTQNVILTERKPGGSGTARADTNTLVTVIIEWRS